MRLRYRAFLEGVRGSLFFVPLVGVVLAVLAAQASLLLDRHFEEGAGNLPLGLASTVQSARSLLATLAGATITFAAIAFSVSLLVIQQASSQYSPRIVHTLFRDPFNKRVMGLVVGTFTYCVVVLRSVRTRVEQGGEAVIPNLSVGVAALLGVTTILAVVAFIDHSAHTMDISEILERVRREAIERIRTEWVLDEGEPTPSPVPPEPLDAGWTVRFASSGWVQQVDLDELLRCVPSDRTLRLESFPGRYAIEGTPLCTIAPPPEDAERAAKVARAAVSIGTTRTMQQDISYGLRQLADVALRALSPGINDPTTAQDAIFHSAAVLHELLRRTPPEPPRSEDRPQLLLPRQPTHADLVGLAFDEVRLASTNQPTVCIYLLETIDLLVEALHAEGLDDRSEPLLGQAELIVAGSETSGLIAADRNRVWRAHEGSRSRNRRRLDGDGG